ncbi:hypothetical protein OOK58_46720 [Streptomyces sp. NBC_01728]|uniref:DUF6777 domain-containing protein n=1 Tax=unclassified Streptomyces TaxID=2593676 RepID=UPI0022588377|nr:MULTISPECIES: DUF6777 domain-containing protein [unclassified Streptomyces]MCX4459357.1 hypothetical protein [Streptomyces sp. NBC_01719]MCX4498714.1 hypothetical protein [Streptomyces sp. NBC_01728]
MSVDPPSSDRPTGPPSGPLSGSPRPGASDHAPTQGIGRPLAPPPGVPPSGDGPGGGGSGGPPGHGSGPDHPWWKSAPRIALITGVVVAGVVIGVVLSRSGGTSGTGSGGEVFLQAANKSGPDPFTESTAKSDSTAPVTPAADMPESANVTRGVSGSAPGFYGGTRNTASCDVEKQIKALRAEPAKNKAFASVADVEPTEVPAYLRSLTPVQLRMDTRVTNHGYRGGAATGYQAVLQTGTAVLVDGHGVPRVRCACGNPLTPAVAQRTVPRRTGDTWPSYRSQNVVVVVPAKTTVDVFVIYDPHRDEWVGRHRGDTDGRRDEKTYLPAKPSPALSMSSSPKSSSRRPQSSSSPSSSSSSDSSSSSSSSDVPYPSASLSSDPDSPSSEPPTRASEPGPYDGLASSDTTTDATTSADATTSDTTSSGGTSEAASTAPGY